MHQLLTLHRCAAGVHPGIQRHLIACGTCLFDSEDMTRSHSRGHLNLLSLGEAESKGDQGAEGQDSEGKEAELTKQLQELQKSEALLTFDVADDWTSVSAHTVQGGMSDMIEAYMKGLYPEGAKLEDQTLALLPKETIMGGAFEADLQASVEGLRGAAGKQLNEMADEAKEFMLGEANLAAQDPEKHLLPHLGKTFGLGLVTQPKLCGRHPHLYTHHIF